MDFIQQFISEEIIYALGWTVVHSLWQGLFIAIIMALILQSLRERSAKLRYEVAGLSLFLVLVFAVSTFILLYDQALQNELESIILTGQAAGNNAATTGFFGNTVQSCIAYFNHYITVIVGFWLVGVVFFLLRLVGGLAYVQKLKYSYNEPLPAFWQKKFNTLASRISLNKPVELLESALVKVPMVIGYFKPVILMPLGAVNNLTENEVEAILAHEIGHIFRNDFILNIALSFIEVLFYYNPAVWWISGNVRLERENCSDDIAIELCGNSLAYAKALVKLQEMNKYPVPSFAMTFSGSKNQMLNRIRRILNQPQNRSNIMEKLTATCLLIAAIFLLSVGASTPFSDNQDRNAHHSNELRLYTVPDHGDHEIIIETVHFAGDTIPKSKHRGTVQIITEENGEKVELKMKNGEIIELKIDGDEIPEDEYGDYDAFVENLLNRVPPPPPAPPAPPAPPHPPMPPTAPAPPAPPHSLFFKSKDKKQTIRKEKNDEGQTVITIESNDGKDPVEIVIDKDEDVIFIEGKALQDGDTAIIIDNLQGNNYFNLFNGEDGGELKWFGNTPEMDEDAMSLWLEKLNNTDIWAFEDNRPSLLYKFNDEALKTWTDENQEKLREYRDQLEAYRKSLNGQNGELSEATRKKMKELEELISKAGVERFGKPLFFENDGANYDFWLEHSKNNRFLHENPELNTFFGDDDFVRDYLVFPKENSLSPKIERELLKDGLIKDKDQYKLELSKKRMKLNGEKQADYIHQKYLKLYESISGAELTGKSKLSIHKNRD